MNTLLALLVAISPVATAKPKAPPPPPVPLPVVAPPDPLATQPVIADAAALAPPTAVESALSNGVSLWVVPNPTLPIFSLVLSVPTGTMLDPAGKEGVATLATELLKRGAGSRNAESFAAEVGRRGLSVEAGTSQDGTSIVLSGSTEQLSVGIDLVADMVLLPKFSGSELGKTKELLVTGLQQNLSEPGWVAARMANFVYWGPTHPYGRPADGTQSGLKKASLGDVKKWHKTAWVPAGAKITVTGAVDAAAVQTALEARLGAGWKGKNPPVVTVPPAAFHRAEPIFIVDEPDSAQTGFYLVFPGLKAGDPKAAPVRMGTIALGGTFTSRLNALLREKKGYTYGVKALLSSFHEAGTLVVRTRIRTDVTAPALTDLLGELQAIRQGISADELTKAKGAFRQDIVESLETVGGTAGAFSEAHEIGLAPDFLKTDLAAVDRVIPASVLPTMSAYDVAKCVIVLVGDQNVIEPELKKAGFTLTKVVSPP